MEFQVEGIRMPPLCQKSIVAKRIRHSPAPSSVVSVGRKLVDVVRRSPRRTAPRASRTRAPGSSRWSGRTGGATSRAGTTPSRRGNRPTSGASDWGVRGGSAPRGAGNSPHPDGPPTSERPRVDPGSISIHEEHVRAVLRRLVGPTDPRAYDSPEAWGEAGRGGSESLLGSVVGA